MPVESIFYLWIETLRIWYVSDLWILTLRIENIFDLVHPGHTGGVVFAGESQNLVAQPVTGPSLEDVQVKGQR